MPKRVRNLMPLIASLDNLHEAFLRTIRGKEGKRTVIEFRRQLDSNLLRMQRDLLSGTFEYGRYNYFEIVDQKRRLICAAPLRENIAFHALMRICHPVFDNYQTSDSYASRKGLGQYMALARAQQYAQRYRWFAKLDVCKFFYSISHEVMLSQLCRLFKDPLLLDHFQRIVRSYEASPLHGLTLGGLPSQYFANHHLSLSDHWVKEHERVAAYIRYMDDMLLFGDDKRVLMRHVRALTDFIGRELRLQLHEPVVNRVDSGIPFLGYVVHRDGLRLSERSLLRYRFKMCHLTEDLEAGLISDQEYVQRAQCLLAFVNKADSSGYRHYLECVCQGIYPQEL